MKSTKKIIASALAIVALVMASCPQESKSDSTPSAPKTDPALNGTWLSVSDSSPPMTMILNNGSLECIENGYQAIKETYTTSGNNFTQTVTHMYGKYVSSSLESKWYTKDEIKASGLSMSIDSLFAPQTIIYSLNGNTLTVTQNDYTMIMIKK